MLSPDAGTLLDMMSDDIVFEFPFPTPDGLGRIEGKTALSRDLPLVGKALSIDVLTLTRCLIADDRKSAVLEFSCQGASKTSGARNSHRPRMAAASRQPLSLTSKLQEET